MIRNMVVFGNSGSEKSTPAAELRQTEGLSHLDLDTLTWLDTEPPERRPLVQSNSEIQRFITQHPQ